MGRYGTEDLNRPILQSRGTGMIGADRSTGGFRGGILRRGIVACAAAAALLAGSGAARSGPCTAQIAALEQQIGVTPPGPNSGPTGPQSLGAQLHRQPTPQDVKRAEHVANKDADAALDRARKADAADDAAACNAALNEAKRLYDIDQH
jgi:hypothetical protein